MTGVNIEGIEKLNKKLGRITAAKTLLPVLQKQSDKIVARAKQYPGAPANSTYRRTNRLRNSWNVRTHQKQRNLSAIISNTASRKGIRYGIYVMGPKNGPRPGTRQAWMHNNRWATLEGIYKQRKKEIVKALQLEVDRKLKG
jgi:lipoprotein-anchoring transpeptidase ErfK/SrfK